MAATSSIARLRARLAPHGYHVFLQPDRPAGWLVVLRRGDEHLAEPLEVRAATRDEALAVAERFFVAQRVAELDHAIRAHGLMPPPWGSTSQAERLEVLARFARAHRLDP